MLVFWAEKLVFLAVPKTGTTAIEGALAPRASLVLRDPPQLKHSPVYRYRRFLAPFFEKAGGAADLETMAVVRHPIDWLGSWWRYRARPDLTGHPNSTADVSFDDFVEEYCRGKPAPFARVGSQAKFLLDPEGAVGVDQLFRYEDQPRMIAFLENRLGLQINLPRLNVSPDRTAVLSPRMEEKLRRKCPDEFRVWDQSA